MKAEVDSPERIPFANVSALKVAIIYEDFASGTRAKHFAERLADGFSCHCPLAESLWRSELLESPEIAADAARAAADCDYLIISLRGDRLLPLATRQWIEAQLDGAASPAAGLIILADSFQGKWRVVEGTRHYLRTLCIAKGVPFFSHAITNPEAEMKPSFRNNSAPASLAIPLGRMPAQLDS
jgi:hypothetical protein